MAGYRYLAHDLRTNAQLGELPLSNVRFGEILNGAGSFSATLPLAVPAATSSTTQTSAAQLLTSSSVPERTALFVERDGAIVWGGIIWTRRRGKSRSAELAGAGFWSYFRRVNLRSELFYTNVDQLTIFRGLINAAQAATGANIGVTVGAETSGVLRTRTYLRYEVPVIADAAEQLAAVDNGFDFAIEVAAGPTKRLVLSYPRRGRQASSTNVAFVDGKNLLSYDVVEDGTRSARVVTALGAGDGDRMLISTQSRTDLIDAGFPATTYVASHKSVTLQSTLDAHALAEVNARAVTPEFWTLQVDPEDPDGGFGSFTVGDDAIVEIGDDENFARQSDGLPGYRKYQRIIGWEMAVADSGTETLTVTTGVAR
jgi:hypothetical protein